MSVADEIPKTEQGCISYIAYAENQIKQNLLHNRRLHDRMKRCQDQLDIIKKQEETHGEKSVQ